MWLGNEFRKRNKKYFFVRTKIEQDIYCSKKARPRTHNAETVLREIRESTEKRLRESGCEDVPVFLIDNYQPHKFQFAELEQQLINDFPHRKRSALMLTLQSTASRRDRSELYNYDTESD